MGGQESGWAGGVRGDPRAPWFFPAEKRVLLVKELQGLPVAQRDHVLRGMPLSLAEKRYLRSGPAWAEGGPGRAWGPTLVRP